MVSNSLNLLLTFQENLSDHNFDKVQVLFLWVPRLWWPLGWTSVFLRDEFAQSMARVSVYRVTSFSLDSSAVFSRKNFFHSFNSSKKNQCMRFLTFKCLDNRLEITCWGFTWMCGKSSVRSEGRSSFVVLGLSPSFAYNWMIF